MNAGRISGFFLFESRDSFAPSDFFNSNDIVASDMNVVLDVENPILVNFENSGSMIPVFSESATGVFVKPTSSEGINVGDIVFFKQDNVEIVHRVVEVGEDSYGGYFITKGDANNFDDGKVMFENVEGILVAIIY